MFASYYKTDKYRIFISCAIIAEDLLLLNFLYWGLLCLFGLDNDLSYQVLQLLISLGYLSSFAIIRINTDFRNWRVRHLLERDFYRLIMTMMGAIGCLFATKLSVEISRAFVFVFLGSGFVLLFILHRISKNILESVIGNGKYREKAIILGAGVVGKKIHAEILDNVCLGIKVLGFFDDDVTKNNGDVLGTIEQAKEYLKANEVSKVYCALPLSAKAKILDFMNFAERNIVSFHVVPTIGYYTNIPVILETVGNMPVFSMRKVPMSNLHNIIMKRAFDI
ncbi:MAG: hypothetical protein LBQ28_10735, partial [Prevotellaceae bacterium]|nr:hypothetical protein [Prevotellaceae bacterium]